MNTLTPKLTTGCFLLHGFGGAYYEIEFLADSLREAGHLVHAPLLIGHGDSPAENKRALRRIRYADWLHSAQSELENFCRTHELEQVYLIGFSMGGLISTRLALTSTVPIAALILINTPFYFWDFRNIARNLMDDFRSGSPQHLRRYLRSGGKLPLRAMIEFEKLLYSTKPLFNHLYCPLMVVQTLDDDSVQSRSALAIASQAKSPVKETLTLESGGHLVLQSASKKRVSDAVADFLSENKVTQP